MHLTKEEILKVKTKGIYNIIIDSPLHKAIMSAMEYHTQQEIEALKKEIQRLNLELLTLQDQADELEGKNSELTIANKMYQEDGI